MELLLPESGSSIVVGEGILFEGQATDANVSSDQLTVSFESDVDGALGYGTINSAGEVLFEPTMDLVTMITSFR